MYMHYREHLIVGARRARLLEVESRPLYGRGPLSKLLVDTELGILRRAIIEGDPAFELRRLYFDAPLHPATFVFAPRPQP
jgi:hypothetical protein